MSEMMQAMMGMSLAAGAGLRACLPLLCVGLLARFANLPLNPSAAFLKNDEVLVALGFLTLIEFVGDKVIAVDHLLDGIGTFARPVAGAILASSVPTKLDPTLAMGLGLLVGGGTAFTVHAGKAATRVKSSALSMFHLGSGNAALSFTEDVLVVVMMALTIISPWAAFGLALLLLIGSVLMVYLFIHTGKTLLSLFRTRRPDRLPTS